jgi:4-hydroxybenzoate polyprenyltransferase
VNLNPKTLRRGFGTICLLVAIGMLVVGETVIEGKLSPTAFLVYWLVCLGFTIMAIITAVADMRALRRETREEQRAMLEHTLQNVQTKTVSDHTRARE